MPTSSFLITPILSLKYLKILSGLICHRKALQKKVQACWAIQKTLNLINLTLPPTSLNSVKKRKRKSSKAMSKKPSKKTSRKNNTFGRFARKTLRYFKKTKTESWSYSTASMGCLTCLTCYLISSRPRDESRTDSTTSSALRDNLIKSRA